MTTAAPPAAHPAAAPAGKGKQAPPPQRPFLTGTLDLETHTYSQNVTLSTSPTPLPTYYCKTNGFLADLFLIITNAATPNTSANVAFNEDGPANCVQVFTLSDTGGQPILGPMSGWELAEFVKYGGFSFSDDWRDSQSYAATTGTSSAGGFFKMILHIPIQFVRREPLGALPNTNNQTVFAVDITVNTLANIYATAPNGTLGQVNFQMSQDSYRQSAGKDSQGNPTVTTPPGLGAVLYLRRTTTDMMAGAQQQDLNTQEGSYRVLMFVMRDSNNSRAQGEADWPDPFRMHFNNDVPYDRIKALWRRRMERVFGYKNTIETPGGQDNGLFVFQFIDDHGLKAGSEDRYRYFNVSAADTLQFDGNIGGSNIHHVTTMFNFVRPPGGNVKALTAR
ncbi:hypothetical protein ACGF12_35855 [Kitasatospora sp. NPDC048296]|uniref:hypothetical protein n=1 Tax=Kitasatospora sp. NPDC048296 TaxID=3364048 RepID=UPI00371E73EA